MTSHMWTMAFLFLLSILMVLIFAIMNMIFKAMSALVGI